MLRLEDLGEEELKRVKETFESPAAAAAGRIRDTTEQLKGAGDSLHDAAAKLHQTTQEPSASMKERGMADDRTILGAADRSRINMQEDYEVRYWTQK